MLGVAIGLSRLPDAPPEPVLRPDDPAAVVAVVDPHRETNYAYPGGLSEHVPGEVRVEQCEDPDMSPATSDCPTFRVIIGDEDQFFRAVTEAEIAEGDIVIPSQLSGPNS